MKIVKNKSHARTATGLLEDITIPQGMQNCMSVEMVETIHLSNITTIMHNKIIKSLRLGVHDARGGLSSVIYNSLCDLYKLPKCYVSADSVSICVSNEGLVLDISAKDVLIRNARGTRSISHYKSADVSRGHIQMISVTSGIPGYCYASGWNCGIRRDEVASVISKEYMERYNNAIEQAIMDIQQGENLVFKTTTGATS